MRVLVTGAAGFIGKTLVLRLKEQADFEPVPWTRQNDAQTLPAVLATVDAVVHLAGVNRPRDGSAFQVDNVDATDWLARCLGGDGRGLPVIMASSVHAQRQTEYGVSKRQAEEVLRAYGAQSGADVYVYRLPNVFGKWVRPNYNSVVGTFAYNVVHGLPLQIDKRESPLRLVYVDDVVDAFLDVLRRRPAAGEFCDVPVQYETTVGALADTFMAFRDGRRDMCAGAVGTGLERALYATYVSYFPPSEFSYPLPLHADARGEFVEMLKTPNSGQFSYFTARPGVTRGGHYHHTKTEKFLVIRGKARFCFRHVLTGERHELCTLGGVPQVVETIPGWTHDITNVGDEELVVMLWANEIFDRSRPDTVAEPV